MSKDTFYFSHDYNTRNDIKIKKLISKHGYFGYGIFWALVEDLYNNSNVLKTDYDTIAFDLRCEADIIKSIINDYDLFVFNGDTFGSLSIEKRLDEREAKSKKARQSAFYRWNKSDSNANALQTHTEGNAIKERKEKERKEKETKEINIEFDSFWSAYDKKVGDKEKLKKKWQVLTDSEREAVMNYIPNYILARPDKQFRKDPATFLNNKSWNDEIVKPANADKKVYKLRNVQGFEHSFELTPAELEQKLSNHFWYLCA